MSLEHLPDGVHYYDIREERMQGEALVLLVTGNADGDRREIFYTGAIVLFKSLLSDRRIAMRFL